MVIRLPSPPWLYDRVILFYPKGESIALSYQRIGFLWNPNQIMSPPLFHRNRARTNHIAFSRSKRSSGSRRTRWTFPQFLDFVVSSCKMLSDVSDALVDEFVSGVEDDRGFCIWNLLKVWRSFRGKQRRRRNRMLLWKRMRFVLWVCFCVLSFGSGLSDPAIMGILGFSFLAIIAPNIGNARKSKEWILWVMILCAVFLLSDRKMNISKWLWRFQRSPTFEMLLKFKKNNW